MIRQLAPLLRFDGYHVLADLTGVPDLYQRIGPVMSGLLPGRWRQPEATALKTWARVVVIAWVLVVVPLMAVSLLLMVLALPRLLATAWASVQVQSGRLARGVRRRRRPWRPGPRARRSSPSSSRCSASATSCCGWSGGRPAGSGGAPRAGPVRRGLAALLAAALVAGLGWAWWPVGRPVPAGAGVGGRHGARRGARVAAARGARGGLPGCRRDDLAGGRRPAAHRRRARAGHGARAGGSASVSATARRTADTGDAARRRGRRRGADLGLPVRPAAAARRGRQPGPRGQHRGRLGALRRHLRPGLGRRGHRRSTERGLRVRQLPGLPHGRRGLPGRADRRFGRRGRAAEPGRRRSTTPASSASPTRWPPSSS